MNFKIKNDDSKKITVFIILFVLLSCSIQAQKQHNSTASETEKRQIEVEKTIQLFGHRNWIVVADAAYPKKSNLAIKTITVDTNQLEVVQFVNEAIKKSSHVQANIFLDKEMSFVAEKDAKGI